MQRIADNCMFLPHNLHDISTKRQREGAQKATPLSSKGQAPWRYLQGCYRQRAWTNGATCKGTPCKRHGQVVLPSRAFPANGMNKRCRQHCKTRAMPLARLLLRHDFQHHIVGGAHGFFADAREVVDALIHAIIDNSLG